MGYKKRDENASHTDDEAGKRLSNAKRFSENKYLKGYNTLIQAMM